MKIAYYYSDNKRSHHIKNAVQKGSRKIGQRVTCVHEREYDGTQYDVAIFYGLIGNLKKIQQEYSQPGKTAILLDLGYWGRHDGGRLEGYHRIAINRLHGADFVNDDSIDLPSDRANRLKIRISENSNNNGYILLCGQSAKAAWVYNMEPEQWERHAIQELRKHTDREIVYWPKNTWPGKKPIPGASYNDRDTLDSLLPGASAVVAHHSNSCMHALLQGKFIYLEDGIAKQFSTPSLGNVLDSASHSNDSVRKFIKKVAHCQWKVEEIRDGSMFKFLTEVGVL